ncbi:MAG: ATP-binding protein [Patescibacteria group bacterium]
MFKALKDKKSFLVTRNLVVAEIGYYLVFMALALSMDWGNAYLEFPISKYLSFTVIEFTTLAVFQILLIVNVITRSIKEEQDIKEVIRRGEHERLEFKTSLRWDVNKNQVNKDLERSAMKTITAFLNSEGGSLILGLDDNGKVHGIESDCASLVRNTHDGFENHFNNLFVSMIGPEFRQHVKLSFHNISDKNISLIEVAPAHRPAYLKTDKGEDFFIRTGNATTSLKVSQVSPYISSQWHR